jgi:hypothetical protein
MLPLGKLTALASLLNTINEVLNTFLQSVLPC